MTTPSHTLVTGATGWRCFVAFSLTFSMPGFVVGSGRSPARHPHVQDKGQGSRGPPIHREQSGGLTPALPSTGLLNNMFMDRSVDRFDNDPSGSPTETLLRILLPLNDKVQWTSRDIVGGETLTSLRSEHFTGPFNR